ncbi:hypothetical protein [Streptomyces sp. XY332]|uniref:hypothetical protein n=1 Tax=Streptomyces sp. XY332 TaxID=1415561 RepID=UPI0006B1F0B0|nr:hypothetical protein [Streptomyces sp. XY332]KOY55058.1 hypothetical protein ADK59_26890 [Streptomyces sp. XY332]
MTHLEHIFSAVALNLIRLDAWWNGHPLDRTCVSHLARLGLPRRVTEQASKIVTSRKRRLAPSVDCAGAVRGVGSRLGKRKAAAFS